MVHADGVRGRANGCATVYVSGGLGAVTVAGALASHQAVVAVAVAAAGGKGIVSAVVGTGGCTREVSTRVLEVVHLTTLFS